MLSLTDFLFRYSLVYVLSPFACIAPHMTIKNFRPFWYPFLKTTVQSKTNQTKNTNCKTL